MKTYVVPLTVDHHHQKFHLRTQFRFQDSEAVIGIKIRRERQIFEKGVL